MTKYIKKEIAIFENEPIRRHWDDRKEKWYFSIVDIIKVLTASANPRDYWFKMKIRVKEEDGFEPSTVCRQLKLIAPDGKMRETDCANTEGVFRIIQSIPSPKAEPFKRWLAKVGYERIKEATDPEIGLNRARKNWQLLGRSREWIEQRMRGQEIRNKLTDYWATHKISEEEEFARLTNIIHKEWSGVTVKKHKKIKSLKGHNLRDNMTEAELIFTALAELSTRKVAEKDRAEGYVQNSVAAVEGGRLSGKAKENFEKLTGEKVVTSENFITLPRKVKKIKSSKKY
jgi:hypothetical protein